MLRRADAETGGVALFGDGEDFGLAIDMPGDDVAAEFVTDLQRALEIDGAALFPGADRRQAQRLFPGFDLEPATVAACFRQARDGQADAGMRDRGAHIYGRGIVAGGHAQLDAFLQG